jgi:hypothetical protein
MHHSMEHDSKVSTPSPLAGPKSIVKKAGAFIVNMKYKQAGETQLATLAAETEALLAPALIEQIDSDFSRTKAKLLANTDDPATLVDDLVSFSVVQLRAFAVQPKSGALYMLREKIADFTIDLLFDVIKSFKTGLKSKLPKERWGELRTPEFCYDPESVLCLRRLYGSIDDVRRSANPLFRSATRQAIDRKINMEHAELVKQFMVAVPLVKRMADVIEAIRDVYALGFTNQSSFEDAVDGRRTEFTDIHFRDLNEAH